MDHCFVQLVVAAYIVLLLVRFNDSSTRHIKWILQLGFSNSSANNSSSSKSSSSSMSNFVSFETLKDFMNFFIIAEA